VAYRVETVNMRYIPNFVSIGQTVAEIWQRIYFSIWR